MINKLSKKKEEILISSYKCCHSATYSFTSATKSLFNIPTNSLFFLYQTLFDAVVRDLLLAATISTSAYSAVILISRSKFQLFILKLNCNIPFRCIFQVLTRVDDFSSKWNAMRKRTCKSTLYHIQPFSLAYPIQK